jgi:enoyl-CoA hydratase
MEKFVEIEKREKIAIVKITREEALNALNKQVLEEIEEAFSGLEKDDEVLAIILTGTGKSFVAGADIAFMQGLNAHEGREFGMFGQKVMSKIYDTPKPVIAAVNGFALGGGLELALACDIRIASEKALFGQPEVSLGITPGFGGTQRLVRQVGLGKAKELIFSGENIKADEAEKIGLVERVYPMDSFFEEAVSLAEKIAARAPIAIRLAKSAINNGVDVDVRTGIQIEADNFGLCFATQDQKDGMNAFLDKKKTEFKGK